MQNIKVKGQSIQKID